MRSTLAKSLLIDFLLTSICLSHGDNPRGILLRGTWAMLLWQRNGPAAFVIGGTAPEPAAVAGAVRFHRCQQQFGLQSAPQKKSREAAARLFGVAFRVEHHQHRRAAAAERGAKDSLLTRKRTQGREQGTQRAAIGLMDAILQRHADPIGAAFDERG